MSFSKSCIPVFLPSLLLFIVTVVSTRVGGDGLISILCAEAREVAVFVELHLGGVFLHLHVAVREGLIQEVLGEVEIAEVQRVRDAHEAGVLRQIGRASW